ncbi:MAG: rRNA maturation RNase YbeY [Phycisphaerales bacterium]
MDETETSTAEPPKRSPGEHAPPGVTIDLIDTDGRLDARQRAWVVDRAGRAIAPLGVSGEVRVRVVGDAEMSREHASRLGVEGTTDVLTFDLGGAGGRELDVDLLVCVDEACRQARAFEHEPERELLLYIVHGVLHCLGYDDADDASCAAMHVREDELLEIAGVGATYAPRRGSSERAGGCPS